MHIAKAIRKSEMAASRMTIWHLEKGKSIKDNKKINDCKELGRMERLIEVQIFMVMELFFNTTIMDT